MKPKLAFFSSLTLRVGFLLTVLLVFSGLLYGNTPTLFEFGMGARPLAMGSAFVGLSDDPNALFYNPAGLAWSTQSCLHSSYETRLNTASYGHVSACFSHLGVGFHFFDFGDVPETDEYGTVLGTFSYRDYFLLGGMGIALREIPLLENLPFSEAVGFGFRVKLLKANALSSDVGSWLLALDFPSLLCTVSTTHWPELISRYRYGVHVENLISLPLPNAVAPQQTLSKQVTVGVAVTFAEQLILAVDATLDNRVRLGLEWTPIPGFSLRAGMRQEGIWVWSFGTGVQLANFVIDYATVLHPYLESQHRVSLKVAW